MLFSENEINKIAYAAYNTSDKIRMESSSGGIFSAFAQEVFLFEGIVYGVYEDNKSLFFIRTDDWNIIKKMRGSKYYQADTTTLDINILISDIKHKKIVLIIGTSCQIGMFYTILKEKFLKIPSNVILVDIICHGVGSKKYIDKYRNELSRKYKKNLMIHKFRSKKPGRIGSQFSKYVYDNEEKEISNEKDYYMRCFFGDIILRPSCYNCFYAGKNKLSDITIGDFNGSDRVIKEYPDEIHCVSAVIINTDKGKRFLENVVSNGFCEVKRTDYETIAEQNIPLLHPSKKPKIRKYIFKLIDKFGVINAVRIISIKYYIKIFIMFIGGKKLVNIIKKILRRKIIES